MDGWYYEIEGERSGPFKLEQMKQLVAVGRIRRDTRVWQPGADASAHTHAGDFVAELATKPNDDYLVHLVPVGRSGWAIAAGYLGLFSLIPVVNYAGLAVSIIAARDLRRHPDKRGWGRVITGFAISVPMTILYTLAIVMSLRH